MVIPIIISNNNSNNSYKVNLQRNSIIEKENKTKRKKTDKQA